jgi:hypothetical protein
VAILSASNTTPRAGSGGQLCTSSAAATDVLCSHHYSEKIFFNGVMKAGNEEMPTPTGGTEI